MFAADAYNRQGYNWGNLMTAVGDTSYGQSVGAGMLMLALDTVLYAALAVYLNFVLPGNGGRTRPCCYAHEGVRHAERRGRGAGGRQKKRVSR